MSCKDPVAKDSTTKEPTDTPPKDKVQSFSLSPETVSLIRREVERGFKEGRIDEAFAGDSKDMPVLLTIPLADDRALVGIEDLRSVADESEVIEQFPPGKQVEPLSLISSAFFVGRGSCYVRFIAGDFSIWIKKPNC